MISLAARTGIRHRPTSRGLFRNTPGPGPRSGK
jgi:hypothetical protein